VKSPSIAESPHGVLLVDKAPDRTSHDVVARVRFLLGTRKVGHAGTLDPMATGLLVLGVGQGTRLLTYLVGQSKTYTATIRLGQAMTTDDREGEGIGPVVPACGIGPDELTKAMDGLRGAVQQVPSSVSAIKVDGKRAYARARAGEEVTLAARPVRIDAFALEARHERDPYLDLDVTVSCSSGTYVRALARDLGAELGVGGHLTALRRTRVGPFAVEGARHVPARGEGDAVELPLVGLGVVAADVLPTVAVDGVAARDLGQGKRVTVPADAPGDGPIATLDEGGRLVAVVEVRDGRLRPVMVIPDEARC
jgi:tRNA pseudouridine55 synthase